MRNLLRVLKEIKSQYYHFFGFRDIAMAILFLMVACCIVSCKVKGSKVASSKPVIPDWSLPGSSTHKQVPPPAGFHRITKTLTKNIGIFDGQSDVGAALYPGSSSFDSASKEYTINSAGYNIWYNRDEFRFLWKKMSGDISLAADVRFPDPEGYSDRKAVVIIRKSLEDDAKEIMVGLHGGGLMHMAWRPEKDKMMLQMKVPEQSAKRIGIVKKGRFYTMFVSLKGEPMHQLGDPIELNIKAPFYVGVGFCSHVPDKMDTAILSNVVLENEAGKVR